MKTAHEVALEETVREKLEELRNVTLERLDRELDNISHCMRNKPFPTEKDSTSEIIDKDIEWHNTNMDRYMKLLVFRRKALKLETFKDLNMDELNRLLYGIKKVYPDDEEG